MNSFFFTQLSDNGKGYRYAGVKRFLKRAKVMSVPSFRRIALELRHVLFAGNRE